MIQPYVSLITVGKAKIYIIVIISLILYVSYNYKKLTRKSRNLVMLNNKKNNSKNQNINDINIKRVGGKKTNSKNVIEGFENNNKIKELEMLLQEADKNIYKKYLENQQQDTRSLELAKLSEIIAKDKDLDFIKTRKEKEDKEIQKYNKILNEHLEAEKKKRLSINLLDIGNNIENGMVNILESVGGYFAGNTPYYSSNSKKISNFDNLIENKKLDNNLSLGNYLYKPLNNTETILQNVESFKNKTKNKNKGKKKTNVTLNKRLNKLNIKNKNSKTKKKLKDLIKGFIQYILDTVKSINNIYIKSYINNFGYMFGIMTNDDNLVSSGIIMIIISLGLFFINITS